MSADARLLTLPQMRLWATAEYNHVLHLLGTQGYPPVRIGARYRFIARTLHAYRKARTIMARDGYVSTTERKEQ